jgi:hypothetical protein
MLFNVFSPCDISALETDFKANVEGNEKAAAFDQNDLLACSCTRHGIVKHLLDVYGGEGYKFVFQNIYYTTNSYKYKYSHKYNLASVANQNENLDEKVIDTMYDICCLIKFEVNIFYRS